jgi:hypothetical protein
MLEKFILNIKRGDIPRSVTKEDEYNQQNMQGLQGSIPVAGTQSRNGRLPLLDSRGSAIEI